tara:strand:+ start:23709 stop:24344 length:636 start_codon:yes stop_codon:yes gene_type:complete
MDPIHYCRQQVAPLGSAIDYSVRYLNDDKANAVIALYAFQHAMHDIKAKCTDLSIADAKLTWWRNEIDLVYTGKPNHPVAQALNDIVTAFSLHQQRFDNIINATESDLHHPDTVHCTGEMQLLISQVLGFSYDKTLEYAKQLGLGLEYAAIGDTTLARQHLSNAQTTLPIIDHKTQFPGLIMAAITQRLLIKPRITPLRMWWIARRLRRHA